MTRCGVLGDPISHSLSPVLHRAAYAALELPWEYEAHRVAADELASFVQGRGPEWQGLSLTMPLKQAAVPLCTWVEPLAETLNAVNTLVRTPAGWSGHNTDVGGCVDAVQARGVATVHRGVVVGSGATAASAVAAMVELGAERVDVLARSVERSAWLTRLGLGVEVRPRSLDDLADLVGSPPADLLVSTIPAQAQVGRAAVLSGLADVVFDVVYEPRVTPLLAAALARKAVVVPGLDLLLHQAARQVLLMTGATEAPLSAMRAALG